MIMNAGLLREAKGTL